MDETRKRGTKPYARQRSANSWEFQAYDGAGKRYFKSWKAQDGLTPRKLEIERDKALAAFVAEVGRGEVTSDKRMTLSEWYEEFMVACTAHETKYKEKTCHEWAKLWEGRIKEKLGHLPVAKITPADISKFHEYLRADTNARTGQPLSASTIRKYHVLLHVMFREAVKHGKAKYNPCEADKLKVAPPPPDKTEAQYLEHAQIDKLLVALEKEELIFRAMVLFALETGVRTGELHGLQWGDFKADKGIIWIRRGLQFLEGKGVAVRSLKTKKSERPIALSDGMVSLLYEWRDEQARWREAFGSELWNTEYGRGGEVLPGDWIWTDEYGNPRYPGSFLPRFKKFLKRAGFSQEEIKAIHTHTLRHTSASLLIEDGVDEVATAARLGHSQTSTTMNIYAHAIAERKAAAQKQGSHLFKNS